MAAAPAGKPTGKVGAAVNAARTLADPNASVADKAVEGTAVAAQAAATAAGGTVVGAVVGQAVRSQGGRKLLAALAALLVTMLVGGAAAVAFAVQAATTILLEEDGPDDSGRCTATGIGTPTGSATGLTEEQLANATAVLGVVQQRGLTAGDAVIAIMTALTESSLRNVDYGDLAGQDSRGLFQQRDSWGSLEVRMDPAGATGLFLDRLTAPALKQYEGYGKLQTVAINQEGADSRGKYPPWRVAQSVQISEAPMGENYRAKYAQAVRIVAEMFGEQVYADARVATWNDQLGPTDPKVDLTGVDGVTEVVPVGNCGPTTPPVAGPGPGAWGGFRNGEIPASALCPISWQPDELLRCDAAAQLEELNAQFKADFGRDLSVNVTYRDLETQKNLYGCGCTTGPPAPPGTSNHGWALAIDINGTATNGGKYEQRKTTVVYRWMALNAPLYLFRENASIREPWHWEYQGSWTG